MLYVVCYMLYEKSARRNEHCYVIFSSAKNGSAEIVYTARFMPTIFRSSMQSAQGRAKAGLPFLNSRHTQTVAPCISTNSACFIACTSAWRYQNDFRIPGTAIVAIPIQLQAMLIMLLPLVITHPIRIRRGNESAFRASSRAS